VCAVLIGALASRETFGAVGTAVFVGALLLGGALLWRSLQRTLDGERRRATEALSQVEANVSRVERLATTGRLAAGIAHEVGNPLAAIATYAHLIRSRAGDRADVAEPLDALEREVTRIDRIVRGLLDYAAPRRVTPRAERVDVVLNDVVRLVTDQGLLRRVRVHWQVEQREAEVYAERHDLEQVFVNLILNAIDAMDGVGELVLRSRVLPAATLRTSIARRSADPDSTRVEHTPSPRALAWLARAERPPQVLQVVVADSGPGVPEADAERVFEPFYSSKPAGRGTGLGLAIVARTVESAGGTIWVQPAREGGAAFVLLLPLAGVVTMGDAME
jgi:signal transduction histidine kinase